MRPAFKHLNKLYICALVPSLCCAAESLEIQTLKRVYSRAPGYMVAIANNPPKHLPENHPWNLQIVAVSTVSNFTAQASNVQFGNESTVEPASDEYSTERHANCTSVDRSYKLTTTQTVESVSAVGYTDLVATTRDSKISLSIPLGSGASATIGNQVTLKNDQTFRSDQSITVKEESVEQIDRILKAHTVLWVRTRVIRQKINIPYKADFVVDGDVAVGPGLGITPHNYHISNQLPAVSDRTFVGAGYVYKIKSKVTDTTMVERPVSMNDADNCPPIPGLDKSQGSTVKVPDDVAQELKPKK